MHRYCGKAAFLTLMMGFLAGLAADAIGACAAGNPNPFVAEATPTSAFVNNNDGTVTHSLTGLMWKQCVQGLSGAACTGTATLMNWQAALVAATADTTGGHDDWRLPNRKELESIAERCGWGPAINQAIFPGTPAGLSAPGGATWSSTSNNPGPGAAWTIEFQFGSSANTFTKATDLLYARLVRSGEPPGAFDARSAFACNADIDGNGKVDALTDGLLYLRALLGLTGTAVTNGALGAGATRTSWSAVRAFINDHCGTMLKP